MLTGTRPTGPIWTSFPRGDYVFIPNPVLMTRWNKKHLSLIYLFRATPHILRIRNLCHKSLLITNCSLNFENNLFLRELNKLFDPQRVLGALPCIVPGIFKQCLVSILIEKAQSNQFRIYFMLKGWRNFRTSRAIPRGKKGHITH